MHWPYRIRLRLRSLLSRNEVERELEEEIEFHLAVQTEANRRTGMSEGSARRAAYWEFGGVVRVEEACRDQIFGSLEKFGQDLRYAARLMRKAPTFSAFIVLSLAFGIGTIVAAFSILNTVLLEALPFPHPESLVLISRASSVPDYQGYSEHSELFSGVAAWVEERMSLTVSAVPETIRGARASASFLPVLGIEPFLGRSFRAEEDRPAGAHVAMLSYNTWQNRFGGDPQIIGTPIDLNAESVTVIGVLPSTFWFPGEPIEIWVPRVFDNRFVPSQMIWDGAGILTGTIARLRSDVPFARAEAGLQVINSRRIKTAHDVHLVSLAESSSAEIRPSLLLLFGAAGCILLVTCANVAGLLLARASARRREIAVRLALGVSRGRLTQQLLIESLPYVVAGGGLGLLLARVEIAALMVLTGHDLVGWKGVAIDAPALALSIGVTLFCALIFGLAPAVQCLRRDHGEGLQDFSRSDFSAGQARLRSGLVVGQTTAAVALTLAAALLLQSYARMRLLRTGIQPEGVATASLRLPDSRYNTNQSRARFYDELLRRVRGIPGVRSVGATSALQPQSTGEGSMTWPEGVLIDPARPPITRNRSVSPGYFRALDIPLIAGRQLTEADDARSPNVMLVNESFARKYYPDGRAIGRHVTYSSLHVRCQIVGVVADVRPRMIDAAAQPEMYFPYMQRSRHEMSMVIRSRVSLATLEQAVRRELRRIDPEQPLYNVQTMEEVMSDGLSRPRSTTSLISFFSVAALALAAVGIYGVLSFTVTLRTREIGIRMALGAKIPQIKRLVIHQCMKLIGLGIGIGIPVALLLSRFFSTLLFGISATEPLTVGAVLVIVATVEWIAAYLPARRAARIDPAQTLRAE
jgi:predicted permease